MCKQAVEKKSWCLEYVPDELKTQEMCENVIRENPMMFLLVSDKFKSREMCESVVRENLSFLQSCWLKVYTDKKTKLSKKASNDF